jgi:predicted alpha/beta hydrolase family esterase
MASRDDSIVPYKQTEDLGRLLQAKFFAFERSGHFLASDGFNQLPIVYEELQNMFHSARDSRSP